MKNLILIVIILAISLTSAQGQTENPKQDSMNIIKWPNVSFAVPATWEKVEKETIKQNLENYVLDSNDVKEMTEGVDANEFSAEYCKYDQETHIGAIPTLRIAAQQITTSTFKQYFQLCKNDVGQIKKYYSDFKYITGPDTIIVDGKKAFHATGTYSIQAQTGEIHIAKISFISVPFGKRALLIILIDSEDDDNSIVLDAIAKSVKLN